MPLTPIEFMFIGYQGLQLLSAIQSALPKPKKEGWYSFFYLLLKFETNNLDNWFQQKYNVAVPRITDEATSVIPNETTTQHP